MNTAVERVIEALDDIRQGKMIILVDDEDRENEGDLVIAAERVTPDAINFMARYGRGLVCLALTGDQIDQLKLPMMVHDNRASLGTAFTVTTGISARDRATTILAAIASDARPSDLVSPGHIFPLRARSGGVLVRTGQTEGSVDLARLAGLKPAGVICEIMRDDGEMARMPDLEVFSKEHDIRIVTVADLISYRLQHERIVRPRALGELRPSVLGEGPAFRAFMYNTEVEDTEYMALVRGDVRDASAAGAEVLVRVQSLDPVGDPFGVKPHMDTCLRAIDDAGVGVFLYVYNKQRTSLTRAFERLILQRPPDEPVEESTGKVSNALRDFGLGAQVLADIGCRKIKLMSNSERRIVGIEGFGIQVVDRVPIETGSSDSVNLRPIDGGASATGGNDNG
jgi:3,4-dihydroxy 2-butanone 4-phosphate synthase/GTP cyclohydrolase II